MFRESENVRAERERDAVVVTLTRASKRNALSEALMRDLRDTIVAAAALAETRAMVIASEGPVFSAGHDLVELSGRGESEYRELFDLCSELMLAIQSVRVPVIAEVQGLATAAGCQLVAACDLAVAADTARFATPGVKIGLFCTTPMVPLVRTIGRKRAMEMLLTGEPIDARTALDWGLVNRVVPAGELRAAALSFAERIARASAGTVAIGKRAFYDQIGLDERAAYSAATDVMTSSAVDEDAQEGIVAFLTKRHPVWRA